MRPLLLLLLCLATATGAAPPAEPREALPPPYDAYFRAKVAEFSGTRWMDGITVESWPARQAAMRRELQGMLGLDPYPARGDLHPVITGTVRGEGYTVEKVQFQSLPGLYVTGNLYLPDDRSHPWPAILYVCGHASVVEEGVSLGNKTHYQHHGSWFARHGYVCLVIDTIELGEIRGDHHGTYNLGRWWWVARGYTPAGVETWNSMRALDYLESRPEVDRTRLAVTGRSGGGAYSWYLAALDDRIQVAVPTAGITTLKNHVLDGCIEGHCDCMYMVNTARWDFDRLAALVAPRPLLIANTDKDPIFPLDGVMEIYEHTRALYRRLGHEDRIGLQIAEGPHQDVQPLNTGAFHWMDRMLQGAKPMDLTDEPARTRHAPKDLRVFTQLPTDETVTSVDQWFGPIPAPAPIPTAETWPALRDGWRQALKSDCFRASLDEKSSPALESETTANGVRIAKWHLESGGFPISVWLLRPAASRIDAVTMRVVESSDPALTLENDHTALALVEPRGVGSTSLAGLSEHKRTHILRRFQLLGETLESGQMSDLRRAAELLRAQPDLAALPLSLRARGPMAVNALYASLGIAEPKTLDLEELPVTHAQGPIYLNVLRHLDVPQAVALAAEHAQIVIHTSTPEAWEYPRAVAQSLGWGEQRVRLMP